ncbi:AAA family ATPase [Candidatus Woesebacteria bacterium]|nr:AAA family ATPase [Candidatus Woesebacteria bacterium]
MLPLIIFAGYSCSGKSTVSKRLIDRYGFDLMEQYVIYREIAMTKGFKRTRYWLADVGNEVFVSETTVETVRRIQALTNSKGVIIDVSYGPRMHAILNSSLPNARIITIAISAESEERVKRMMGRMGASLEEAEVELTFRDKFLSEIGLQTIIEASEFRIKNKGSVESVLLDIDQILGKYGIVPLTM